MTNKMMLNSFIILVFLMFFGSNNNVKGQDYDEKYRPQFHFSPEKNWINDPNGMVYFYGEYHLMYQYNPYGNQWGNMSWGHAVSPDMVHWEELDVALYPDELGAIFSGGAVIDVNNTAGFGHNAMIAIYTSAGDEQQQSIAYSLDKGRTWTKYAENPVLPNQGTFDFRDPMVFWHKEAEHWVMALAVLDIIEFYSSDNLIDWQYESSFGKNIGNHSGGWECPDFFKVGDHWVLIVSNWLGDNTGSGSQYFVGDFDGYEFTLSPDYYRELSNAVNFPQGELFEDFEGDNYAGWTVTGTAFGTQPAEGTLEYQQFVTGFLGDGLVNTFLGGDEPTGSLTSQEFILDYNYINFLIGGGNHPDGTAFQLLHKGEIVRTATGKDNEMLNWRNWDVAEYRDSTLQLRIIDNMSGGWGHINLDHIYLSNEKIEAQYFRNAFLVDYGPDNYAGRSFENFPDDRRVFMGWNNNLGYGRLLPTDPWRGNLTLPRVMDLKEFSEGIRLIQTPIEELNKLYGDEKQFSNLSVNDANVWLINNNAAGTYFKIEATLPTGQSSGIEIRKGDINTTQIKYEPSTNEIVADRSQSGGISFFSEAIQSTQFRAPVLDVGETVKLTIYVDDTSVEVFANEGEAVISFQIFPENDEQDAINFTGSGTISEFVFWPMKSIYSTENHVSVEDDELSSPQSISIKQNYPNPFNPITQINFTLPETEFVELVIVDSLGQKVATLVREQKSAGEHTVSFDGTGLSSGVYFYKFQAGNYNQTKKMLLIK